MPHLRPLAGFSRTLLRQSFPSRSFSVTTPFARPDHNPNDQRDAQLDRQKMNTEANEYAKSGTDNTTAGQQDAAFDPKITDPQEAKKKAGEGNEVNPLDASPANVELSQPNGNEKDTSGNK